MELDGVFCHLQWCWRMCYYVGMGGCVQLVLERVVVCDEVVVGLLWVLESRIFCVLMGWLFRGYAVVYLSVVVGEGS